MDSQASDSNSVAIEPDAGRRRRCAVFAPTTAAGWAMAVSMFLPLGMYRGCGNSPPQAVAPYERQSKAFEERDFTGLVLISIPYAFGV